MPSRGGSILDSAQAPEAAPALADAFTGGGAVALFGKLRGYVVHTNDWAERSVIAGFVEANFCPDVVTRKHARFIDNAIAVARRTDEPKRSLCLQLVLKVLTALRPAGNYGAKTIVHQAEDGRWDEMNPSFVRGFVPVVTAHPKRLAEAARRQINRGVFQGVGPCRAYQQDAREFLTAAEADVAYLDPPYGPGVLSYESALKTVDSILAGELITPTTSDFSTAGWERALDELLDAAGHIPLVVLSFGNATAEVDALAALVRRHDRAVEAEAITYAHMAGLASAESRARNQELIIVGRKNP